MPAPRLHAAWPLVFHMLLRVFSEVCVSHHGPRTQANAEEGEAGLRHSKYNRALLTSSP